MKTMKKLVTLSIGVMLLCLNANAQPDTLWTQTYGTGQMDRGNCVLQTSDGGFIVTGTYDYNLWSWDSYLYLLKTDASGNVEWEQITGGDNTYEGFCVRETSDGGFIIAGYTGYTYQFDVLLVKTDSYGNIVWTQIYGGNGFDGGYSVQQTSDGGYIIAGNTVGLGSDVWLIKTDANGIEEWNQTFGGSEADFGESVQQTSDGGYIIAGYSASFGAGDDDAYIIKTDASGNEEWYQVYGGPTGDYGYDIRQTTDGGYIMAGMTTGYGEPNGDVYLIKMDASGTVEWIRHPGGDNADAGYSVKQTDDSGYIVAGYTESYGAGWYDAYLVKFDVDGNEEWQQTVGGRNNEESNCVQQTDDGGYILTGYTESYGAGGLDLYLVRLEGETTPPDVMVTLTPFNPPIQIPASGGSFDFNIEATNNLGLGILMDVWAMATLPNGTQYGPVLGPVEVEIPGGTSLNRDRTQGVPARAPTGNYTYDAYIGYYPDDIQDEDHFDFEKLAVSDGGASIQDWNCWGAALVDEGVVAQTATPSEYTLLLAYPNPFNPTTEIGFVLPQADRVSLKVYDASGALVTALMDGWRDAGMHEVTFDASGLSSGIYFYTLNAGDFSSSGKMILMK